MEARCSSIASYFLHFLFFFHSKFFFSLAWLFSYKIYKMKETKKKYVWMKNGKYCRPSFVIRLGDLLKYSMSLGVNLTKKRTGSLVKREREREMKGWPEMIKKNYFSLSRSLQFHWNWHGVRVHVLMEITMMEVWIHWIDFWCS